MLPYVEEYNVNTLAVNHQPIRDLCETGVIRDEKCGVVKGKN